MWSSVAIGYRNKNTIDRTLRQTRRIFDIYCSSYPDSGSVYGLCGKKEDIEDVKER